jgi:hypothetical protein
VTDDFCAAAVDAGVEVALDDGVDIASVFIFATALARNLSSISERQPVVGNSGTI